MTWPGIRLVGKQEHQNIIAIIIKVRIVHFAFGLECDIIMRYYYFLLVLTYYSDIIPYYIGEKMIEVKNNGKKSL